MANLTVTASQVAAVEIIESITAPLAEAIAIGQMARLDTSNGRLTLAKATTAAEARVRGMLISKDGGGTVGTVVKRGLVNVGEALAGLGYDADVYLSDTDGTLDDGAGTVSRIVGYVAGGFGATTADKLLKLEL